jgi:hypothetical protein
MQAAGHALGITGGHCDENAYKPRLFDGSPKTRIANGVEEVRAAVRRRGLHHVVHVAHVVNRSFCRTPDDEVSP